MRGHRAAGSWGHSCLSRSFLGNPWTSCSWHVIGNKKHFYNTEMTAISGVVCLLFYRTLFFPLGKHCGQPEVLGRTVGVKCMKSNTPCHIPEVRPRAPSDPKRKCSNCFLPRKPSKACFWKTQSRGRKRWEDKVSPMDTKHWESTSDVSAHAHQGLAQLQGPAVAARGAGPCLTPLCFTCCSPLG